MVSLAASFPFSSLQLSGHQPNKDGSKCSCDRWEKNVTSILHSEYRW